MEREVGGSERRGGREFSWIAPWKLFFGRERTEPADLACSEGLVSAVGALTQGKDASECRGVSFDLARHLLSDHWGHAFSYRISEGMFNINHLVGCYQRVMRVYGEALVIASAFDESYKRFMRPSVYDPREYFNDGRRNMNRLAGFFRSEGTVSAFVEAFKSEPKGSEPWFVDSQFAILDVIDGVEFRDSSILAGVVSEMKRMRVQSSEWNRLVCARFDRVVSNLGERGVVGGKTSAERLVEEFEGSRELRPERTRLYKTVSKVRRRGYGIVDLGAGPDPIDLAEGFKFGSEEYWRVLNAGLRKTRIDYRRGY
ncbi:MAG: hypothetical protein V1875_03450 [Candidatus Altiarchaeota archaeon]